MALEFDSSILYKLDNGYYITKVTGEECSLVFKDPENAVVAILESCGGKVTRVAPYRGRILKTLEKNDIAKGHILSAEETEEEPHESTLSEAEKILAETDLNTLSPMQAL